MFARFDENPAMTLRVIKETKRYGRTDGRTDARTDGRTDGRTDNVKTVYPLQTKFAGGINRYFIGDFQSLLYRSLRCATLFDLIIYIPPTIFQLNRDRSSWVEPVLS